MKYENIIKKLRENKILLEYKIIEDKNIDYISYNSKNIKYNTLFFCKGKNYKKEYLDESIDKGIIAYISEIKYNNDLTYFIVSDINKAMAVIATFFYNYSFNNINTIGITGTKGKTTVTYLLNNILNEFTNSKNAIISSIDTYTNITKIESFLTTPEAIDLNRYFNEIVDSNINYLTMEVSSQAYKMNRVDGVNFNHGIFLNISEDHISENEHLNFEDYFDCKLKLLENSSDMVVNRDMQYFYKLKKCLKDKKYVTYGKDNRSNYYYSNVVKEKEGFSFDVINDKLNYNKRFRISLNGRFNIENAIAAIVMAKVLDIDDKFIFNGIVNVKVKGRMEVYNIKGRTVIVDYAHNLLSYNKLFESVKTDYPERKIISLGGCVGNKAYNRRSHFANIVGKNSDYIYLTEVDSGYEDTNDICEDIISSFKEDVNYLVITNRAKAISKMIECSKIDDVLILLSKGNEKYLKVKGDYIYYDSDINIVRREFDKV